ncbi:DegT/DnrJ/EryC1/StrS family aminotransferase [Longimicrobium terrae]|uniref:dTDP-4-amino-4,6-dideoxygalactose transaminase n=1 Tax=Longimicrobium terrae TaxID=1639882 RepID=A0A841GWA4_9BACT|nr:DegT/DnrJ/EryC1/StrS family aminotransferase [Longimicrobium terrae]MBB4634644.1 dTDP-4-amino-4,6-dideoxygalactose transaminase [Longimicrobium terrae]MBB6068466.1 dTDP-4-amino-4,6-dideoxygalactose transaminase [Longimicrobium terrae]NNC27659.1 DegT/DnrJ/EryC1/StrS family aminotransferase [Longimicrobium terrae]
MNVPLLDLTLQYRGISTDVMPELLTLIDEQRFILGPVVERFEREVETYLDVPHAIGCASGTDAILLALRAYDCGRDTEVVTSPFTFFATAGAIHNVGARPVFADIDPDTFNLDPAAAEAAVTDRTRVVMPVHLFGQMADMAAFRALADRRGVKLLEDAAQAIAARQRVNGEWITTGSLGDACAFSFFPTKNLGAFGDAGMTVTQDADTAERLRKLRVHGGRQMYHHEEVGYNSRLDTLQAAVLSAKLPHLRGWSDGRRKNAAFYDQALAGIDEVQTPVVSADNESIYNQYTLRVRGGRRDALADHLREKGIGSGVYYPVPLHLQECFEYLGYKEGQFPESELACREVLSLPVFPELTEAQLAYVAESIRAFFRA